MSKDIDVVAAAPAKAGLKFDGGKPPIWRGVIQYFPRALEAVATVSEYGSRKYDWNGWQTVPDGVARYSDAHVRHQVKEIVEGAYDDGDSGLAHAAQVAWNALARLEKMLESGAVENRRGNDIGPDGKPVLGTARAIDAPRVLAVGTMAFVRDGGERRQ